MKRFHRILHPTDFSAVARTVFRTAVMLAKDQRAEPLLLHVLPPPTMFFGGRRTSLATQFAAGVRGAAHSRLSLLLAKAKQSKVRARAFLVEGDPDREIVRAARSRGVDLIVMGTHGRAGASRLFLGSVAERVVRLAPTASSPQAWAAGAPLLFLRVLLGLDPHGPELAVDPALPERIARLALRGIPGRFRRADAVAPNEARAR